MPEKPFSSEQLCVAKAILAYLNGQGDNRATSEELIAFISGDPQQFCDVMALLRAKEFIQARDFSREFVQEGGDSSFQHSVMLTQQGQMYYIDLVKKEYKQ